MTLPSSGTLALSQIQGEFGGSNPIGLSEYYAGGSYVSSGTSGIPSSGQISISQFYGKSALIVDLSNYSVYGGSSIPGNPAFASLTMGSNGDAITESSTQSPTTSYFVIPSSEAPNYEIRAYNLSGSVQFGSFNTWLSLANTRLWQCLANPVSTQSATFNLEIRRIGTTTILDTCTVTITASAEA